MQIVSLCSAALEYRELNVYEGRYIDLSQNKAIDSMCGQTLVSGARNCPNPQCDSSDFRFIRWGNWDTYNLDCGGEEFWIYSEYKIQKLNIPAAIDFSKPLDISDTALFSRAPLFNASACSTWTMDLTFVSGNPCDSDWTPPSPPWNISKTYEGNYFLFRVTSKKTVHSPGVKDRDLITISTILQPDGSLNFKGAPVAVLNSEKQTRASQNQGGPLLTKQFGTPSIIQRCDRVYDVCGRLLNASSGTGRGVNRASMIYFVRKANSFSGAAQWLK